jgi:RNA polymerase sigma-70 factor (ECF subfamily)
MGTIAMDPREEARFNELMKATYRKVYNMAYRLSGNRSDAEDLTQDAFYRAYRSFADYQGDRPFENWIYRIVTRLFLDLLRNRGRRIQAVSYDAPLPGGVGEDTVQLDIADVSANAEQVLMGQSLSEDLEAVVQSLTPDQRLLIQLADIEHLPYNEIAAVMNKPVGTIRSRLHRTHKLIRLRLERLRAQRSGSVAATRLAFQS